MNITTIGVDLAKNCFQLAGADASFRVVCRERLTRTRFVRRMSNCSPCTVVMEACGSSTYWARRLEAFGHVVKLLPAQHVRAYVRRSKTDAADAAALIEASRCEEIRPVAVKSVEQQVLQQLHRLRFQWQGARKSRLNSLRAMLREFGIDIPVSVARSIAAIRAALEAADNGLPHALRPFIERVLEEIRDLACRIEDVERALREQTLEDCVVQRMQQMPGVGLIVATAMRAAIGDIHRRPTSGVLVGDHGEGAFLGSASPHGAH